MKTRSAARSAAVAFRGLPNASSGKGVGTPSGCSGQRPGRAGHDSITIDGGDRGRGARGAGAGHGAAPVRTPDTRTDAIARRLP